MRPLRALKPGRYVLDARGRLHPWRRRYVVRGVAVVTVRARGVAEVDAAAMPFQTTANPEAEKAARKLVAEGLAALAPPVLIEAVDVPEMPVAAGDAIAVNVPVAPATETKWRGPRFKPLAQCSDDDEAAAAYERAVAARDAG